MDIDRLSIQLQLLRNIYFNTTVTKPRSAIPKQFETYPIS